MTEDERIEAVAKALRAEAKSFCRPVALYVEGESKSRWDREHPDKFASLDGPEIDWDLESWKILARAALKAAS